MSSLAVRNFATAQRKLRANFARPAPCSVSLPKRRVPSIYPRTLLQVLATENGTDRPFAALQRFRPVTELFSLSRRACQHSCS